MLHRLPPGAFFALLICAASGCEPDRVELEEIASVELVPPTSASAEDERCSLVSEALTESDRATLCGDDHDARLELVLSTAAAEPDDRVLTILDRGLSDEDVRVRRESVAYLLRLGPAAAPLTSSLIARLSDESQPIGDRARSALAAIGSHEAAAALLDDLNSAETSAELERRLSTIAHFGHPVLVPFYARVIAEREEATLRALSAQGLIAGGRSSSAAVAELIASADSEVRALAFRITGALPAEVGRELVVAPTPDDSRVDSIWRSAASARIEGGPVSDVILTTLSDDRSVPAVEAALDACAYLGTEQAIALLIEHLADPRLPDTRHAQTLLLRLGMSARDGLLNYVAAPPEPLDPERSEQLLEVLQNIATANDVPVLRDASQLDALDSIEDGLAQLANELLPPDPEAR